MFSELILGLLLGKRPHWPIFFPVASNSLRSLCHSLLGLVSLIPSRFFNGEYMQTSLLYISVLFQFTSIDEYLESYVFEISPCLRTKVRLIHERQRQFSLIGNVT